MVKRIVLALALLAWLPLHAQVPVAPCGVKISPFLLPALSYHEPPIVNTWPVESSVSPS